MGEDDDEPLPSVKDVLFDGSGSLQWRRVLDAVQARGTDDTDLVPLLAVGLLAAVVGGPLLGFVEHGTVARALEAGLWWVVAYLFLAVVFTVERVKEYYSEDEGVAIEELRSRYAGGEIDLEEFQRRVERVYEDGAETVWAGAEPGAGGTDDHGDPAGGRDPAAILRERYARGEIGHDEFRRRMRVLGEEVEPESAERVTEREY